MIRDHEGRWLWSGESQNQFAKAQNSIPIVVPRVDEAAREIIFASTNIPSLLGMTPVLSLNANGRYLATRMNGSYQIASVDDAERGSTLRYFGLPSSDIIIQAHDGAEVFPDGDSWTFDREGITEYGELTNVNVEVSSVRDGRQFTVNVEVELISYLGDASQWSHSMNFNNILHVQRYLNRELPWSRFRLGRKYEFSHLLIFPGEAKRANSRVTNRAGTASCRFTLQPRGFSTRLFCGLFIGGDRKPHMLLSRNYSDEYVAGYFEGRQGFGVRLAGQETLTYSPERASTMLLHPSLYNELSGGSCYHKTICIFEPFTMNGPSCRQIHIALGTHEQLDSNPGCDENKSIEGFRLICENIDVTKDLVNNIRILLAEKHSGAKALRRGVLVDHHLIHLTMDGLKSVNGVKTLELEIPRTTTLNTAFSQMHVLAPSQFRPSTYSPTSSRGFNESRFDSWSQNEGRYVLMGIIKPEQIDFAGLYLHFIKDSDNLALAHFRLRPSNARDQFIQRNRRAFSQGQQSPPPYVYPTRLHEILFPSPGMNQPEDFLYNGLPLAMVHINDNVWCLCLEKGSEAPLIKGLNYQNGAISRFDLEFDEGDKRWHLPETQRALESNSVYSWLLSLLEVME